MSCARARTSTVRLLQLTNISQQVENPAAEKRRKTYGFPLGKPTFLRFQAFQALNSERRAPAYDFRVRPGNLARHQKRRSPQQRSPLRCPQSPLGQRQCRHPGLPRKPASGKPPAMLQEFAHRRGGVTGLTQRAPSGQRRGEKSRNTSCDQARGDGATKHKGCIAVAVQRTKEGETRRI